MSHGPPLTDCHARNRQSRHEPTFLNLLFSNAEAASPAPPFTANCEPTLDEILEDPIVRQLMARDGVTEATGRRFADGMGESMVRGEQPR